MKDSRKLNLGEVRESCRSEVLVNYQMILNFIRSYGQDDKRQEIVNSTVGKLGKWEKGQAYFKDRVMNMQKEAY